MPRSHYALPGFLLLVTLASCSEPTSEPTTVADEPSAAEPELATAAAALSFYQVSAGSGVSCGRTDAGVGYCWGYNYLGAVGDGTKTMRTRPVRIVGPS